MLANIRQDEIGRNRCDLVQARFAKLALNVVFRRKTKAFKTAVVLRLVVSLPVVGSVTAIAQVRKFVLGIVLFQHGCVENIFY